MNRKKHQVFARIIVAVIIVAMLAGVVASALVI